MSEENKDTDQEKIDQQIYRMLLIAVYDMSNVISIMMKDGSPIQISDQNFVNEMLPKLAKYRELAGSKILEMNGQSREDNANNSN